MIQWSLVLTIFLATLPLLGVILWNLLEVKSGFAGIRAELLQIRGEIAQIKIEMAGIRERLATLEERDRHPVLIK